MENNNGKKILCYLFSEVKYYFITDSNLNLSLNDISYTLVKNEKYLLGRLS
jgi:hypothetical protein